MRQAETLAAEARGLLAEATEAREAAARLRTEAGASAFKLQGSYTEDQFVSMHKGTLLRDTFLERLGG